MNAQLVEEPEYYLWSAEINILRKYSQEIALRIFGHSTRESAQLCKDVVVKSKDDEQEEEQNREQFNGAYPHNSDREKEKWGDQRVGRHNGGVNAEEGLDGDCAVGCASLVELGAGSLRKVGFQKKGESKEKWRLTAG
jgi:hypothetical protein